MNRVILFGGGDGGGIIIGPDGVRPIPPFDPGILLQFKAVAHLTRAQPLLSRELQRQLAPLLNKTANLLVGQVERLAGPLDAEAGIVFQDADGGFTCGSTGKPPIPLPWPPSRFPVLDALLERGVLDRGALDVVRESTEKGASLSALLRDPLAELQRVGIKPTAQQQKGLQSLRLADPAKVADPVDREVVQFFHAAAADDRLLREALTQPEDVAAKVNFKLGKEAAERIRLVSGGGLSVRGPGTVMNPVAVAVLVATVIMLYTRPEGIPVRDLSGIEKF